MSKIRVAVIFGGPSKEHEVSIKTGQAMLNGLDEHTHEVTPVFISKDGQWQIADDDFVSQNEALIILKSKVDVCLIGLHGTFGEDGQIQTLFETSGIKYTGSDSNASKLAMEKHLASKLYDKVGLRIPEEMVVTKWDDSLSQKVAKAFKSPIVIKPESQGSSVGVSIIDDLEDLHDAVERALKEDSNVLIQQYINGREVSCGVLEVKSKLMALPPTEVMPLQSRFYDYSAKYDVGATKEVTPPENMESNIIDNIKEIAVKAHEILGCSGYSRTDMIIEDGVIYVIETNTLPGMTVTSFLPQQVAAEGMAFSELLDIIIQAAIKRSNRHV